MQALLREYPVVVDIPIAWGDMDAFRHVNNVVYFKHFECARVAYLENIDFLAVVNRTGIGPILAATRCQYKIPLTYPDQVRVGAKVDRLETDRFMMKYVVVSRNFRKIAAVGDGEIVAFDYQRQVKTAIPDAVRSRIIHLENSLQ